MPSILDQLRSMTVVVADTGEFDAVKRLKPVDCTTNPTLILKAANSPGGAELVEEALAWGRAQGGSREAVVTAVARRLSVSFGVELSKLVPGRVSTEVDADLSFDAEATVAAAREIVRAYEARGVGREKVLVKIASTWEGIEAARALQAEGIDCNLTLLFSLPQALAAAEAGAYLISPFVGRILDWHVKNGAGPFEAENDPGVKSVRTIHAAFKSRGHSTIVMGASFRNVGQIKALAGCDRLTISPALLDELAKEEGDLPRRLHDAPRAVSGEARTAPTPLDEPSFRWALNEDAMASEKLSDGIRLFAKDLRDLQSLLHARLDRAA